jgi:hypothetical protein
VNGSHAYPWAHRENATNEGSGSISSQSSLGPMRSVGIYGSFQVVRFLAASCFCL